MKQKLTAIERQTLAKESMAKYAEKNEPLRELLMQKLGKCVQP